MTKGSNDNYQYNRFGVKRNNRWLLLPWMIVNMLGLVIFSMTVYGAFVVLSGSEGVQSGLILIAIYTPFLILGFYFWFVVNSVYDDTKKNDQVLVKSDLEQSETANGDLRALID
jgi:nitrogen fixation-related uncharacterized protein